IVIPLLIGMWGMVIFRGKGHDRATRISFSTLLVVTLLAAIFGTIQLVGWMPHPSHEWSGAVGSFIASILTGLIGTAGSTLVLMAAIFISLVYALDIDIRKAIEMGKLYFDQARDKA